jgi:hypothetical protein
MTYIPNNPIPATSGKRRRSYRKTKFKLSPVLTEALAELAAVENLPLAAFITILVNEALTQHPFLLRRR